MYSQMVCNMGHADTLVSTLALMLLQVICVDFCVMDSFCGKGYIHGSRDGCLKKLSRQWGSVNRHKMVGAGRGWLDKEWRKNSIIIFGLVVMRSEGYVGSGVKVLEGDSWAGVVCKQHWFYSKTGQKKRSVAHSCEMYVSCYASASAEKDKN